MQRRNRYLPGTARARIEEEPQGWRMRYWRPNENGYSHLMKIDIMRPTKQWMAQQTDVDFRQLFQKLFSFQQQPAKK
jgi:hypothetical protein